MLLNTKKEKIMKVYDFEGFPNPLRVRVALKEKGVFDQIDFVTVDVPNGEHRQADFLAKNPSGAVPAKEYMEWSAKNKSLS